MHDSVAKITSGKWTALTAADVKDNPGTVS